jgi:hypothetical protein
LSVPAEGAALFDHAVYAGPSLDAMIDELEGLTGIRAAHGGAHEGLGTHNALLGLGEAQYLELLAPMPAAKDAERSGFAAVLGALPRPRLFMWAVRVQGIDGFVERCTAAGLAVGSVASMSRTPPGAAEQHWKLTTGGADVYGSVLPFAIEWSPPGHPSAGLAPGCTVASFRAEHPEPERMRDALQTIGFPLPVDAGAEPGLILEIDSPAGRVALR